MLGNDLIYFAEFIRNADFKPEFDIPNINMPIPLDSKIFINLRNELEKIVKHRNQQLKKIRELEKPTLDLKKSIEELQESMEKLEESEEPGSKNEYARLQNECTRLQNEYTRLQNEYTRDLEKIFKKHPYDYLAYNSKPDSEWTIEDELTLFARICLSTKKSNSEYNRYLEDNKELSQYLSSDKDEIIEEFEKIEKQNAKAKRKTKSKTSVKSIPKKDTPPKISTVTIADFTGWRRDDPPTFKNIQLKVEKPLDFKGEPSLKKQAEDKCIANYKHSQQMMEHTVGEVASEEVSKKSERGINSKPFEFAKKYSQRYLDLMKASVEYEYDNKIPMIPVTAGQLKLRGFSSKQIFELIEPAKEFTEISKSIKYVCFKTGDNTWDIADFELFMADLTNGWTQDVKTQTGIEKMTLREAFVNQKNDPVLDQWVKDHLKKKGYRITEISPELKNETLKYMAIDKVKDIDKVHFMLHEFGHKSYSDISEQLYYVGIIDKKSPSVTQEGLSREAAIEERLLMEIRHRIAGDGTIEQNAIGTVGSNPLAYLKMLEEGEIDNPLAEFRERMFFSYMLNYLANDVIENKDLREYVNKWLEDNKKDWDIDENFASYLYDRLGGTSNVVPPLFRYGANAALNSQFRSMNKDEDVAKWYKEHPNPTLSDVMEMGARDINAFFNIKLSDRELMNQTGEWKWDVEDINRTRKQLNYGTGAAVFNLAPIPGRIKPGGTEYMKQVEDLHLPVIAGISGTLDQSVTMAGLVGIGVEPTLNERNATHQDIKLAFMAFMLPGFDHTVHEIMQSSKTYGLEYEPGPGFTDYLYPSNPEFKKNIEARHLERRNCRLPEYYLSEEHFTKTYQDLYRASEMQRVKDYQAFTQRISSALKENINPELAVLLNREDRDKILKYILDLDESKIKELELGSTYHLKKEDTGLPRTIDIVRSRQGEFKLIVSTKSKLASNEKDKNAKKIGGAIKRGQVAWRIDKEEQYFLSVAKIKSEKDLQEYKAEAKIGNSVESSNVADVILGSEYLSSKNERKIGFFSSMATNTLDKKLKDLTPEQVEVIIGELIEGLKSLHEHGWVHQDLKPENVLIYRTEDGYHAKITDFGETRKQGDRDEWGAGPHQYQSPELCYFYSNEHNKNPDYKTYISKYYSNNNSLAMSLVKDESNKKLYPKTAKNRDAFKAPDKKNDLWALGVMIHQLRNKGELPKDMSTIEKDELVKGLMEVNRNSRIDINKAKEIHNKQRQQSPKFDM